MERKLKAFFFFLIEATDNSLEFINKLYDNKDHHKFNIKRCKEKTLNFTSLIR